MSAKQLALAFLNGLDAGYDNTVENIMTSDDAMEVSSIVSKLLIVEERVRSRSAARPRLVVPGAGDVMNPWVVPTPPAAAAFYTQVQSARTSTPNSNCRSCDMPGHTKDKCRRLRAQKSLGTVQPYANPPPRRNHQAHLAMSGHDWPEAPSVAF